MPSPNPATRREHAGAAAPSALTASITGSDLSFTLASGTNWPTGAVGVFFVVLDPGESNEEKVLCSSRSGVVVTITPTGRGQDGTAASSHGINAVAYPAWSATEADELNAHAAASTDVHGISGALAAASALAGKQPLDTELTALAGLTSAADQLPYFTGSGTAALTTLSAFIRTLLDDANALTARTTLSAQAYAAALDAIAQLTPAADRLPYYTGAGTAALANFAAAARSLLALTAAADALPYFTSSAAAATTTLTAFARTLLDDADAATMRATLGAVIGTDVQAFDSGLAALAAYNSNGFLVQSANNTFVGRTLLEGTGVTISNPTGASNPTISTNRTSGTATALGSHSMALNNLRLYLDNLVMADLRVTLGSSITVTASNGSTTNTAICNLPAGYRPTSTVAWSGYQDNTSVACGGVVLGTGNVEVRWTSPNSTLPSGTNVFIEAMFNLA